MVQVALRSGPQAKTPDTTTLGLAPSKSLGSRGCITTPTDAPVQSEPDPEHGSPGVRRPFSGNAPPWLGRPWPGPAPGSPRGTSLWRQTQQGRVLPPAAVLSFGSFAWGLLRASRRTGLARLCLAHHRPVPSGLSPAGPGPAPGQHPDVDSPPSLHLRAAQPAVAHPVHAEGPRVWLVLLHQRPVSREVPPAGLGRCPVRASARPLRRSPRRELGSPCWTSILPAVSYPARGSASVGRGYIWGGDLSKAPLDGQAR